MFKLKNLSKTFRTGEVETTALDRIDLDIEPGEYLAITGPSGCGKSTLLGILGLLDAATSGEYWFDGHNVAGWSERQLNALRRGRIGFVFQSFNLIDELSVADNIGLALEYGSVPPRERGARVAEAMERLGITHRANTARASSAAASSSAWPSPGPSSPARPCCWPTSPPATWTAPMATRSCASCASSTPRARPW
jgi:ABC-type lipoprotein export system ATPase subunit